MESILTFGQWIKYRRKSLDLTQEQLANQVSCSAAAIKKMESDERRPSRQIAARLAEALQLLPEQQEVFVRVARGELSLERLPEARVEARLFERPVLEPAPAVPLTQKKDSHLKIPAPGTPLVGRERELEKITRLLQEPQCRILTLTGVGGAGKTRLAIESAIQLQDVFADGAAFVSLAGIDSPAFIVPAIASTLNMAFSGPDDPKRQLFQSLRGKNLLLVLDNLEHLLDGIEMLGELLQQAPGVKLLATSREQLHLQAEWVFEVRGLPVPQGAQANAMETSSAAMLFFQRARQAKSDFQMDARDYEAVGRICQLVQGLPLAIELAARWTRTLSCLEIAQEIEQGVEFLAGSTRGPASDHSATRDASSRHRSIRAVFDHSWQLLTADEQRVIKRLSVFRGGFRREAAEQIAGANLLTLSALIDKSLVRRSETNRYDIHDLVRQYLAARLAEDEGEEQLTRTNHSRYYLTLIRKSEPALRSRQQKDALAALDTEIDNIRLAWNTAVEQASFDLLCETSGSLYYYYELHQYFKEAERFFHHAADWVRLHLEKMEPHPADAEKTRLQVILATLLNYQGFFNQRPGNNREALALFESSLVYLRPLQLPLTERFPLAFALVHIGVVYWAMGNFEQAQQYFEEGLSITRAMAPTWLHSMALGFLGGVSHDRGDYSGAYRLLDESVKLCQLEGDPEITMLMLLYYTRTLMVFNKLDEAQALLQEGLTHVQETGNRWLTALGLEYLARIARMAGDNTEAYRKLEQSIQLHRSVGDLWSLSLGLIELSRLMCQMEDYSTGEHYALESFKIAADVSYQPIAIEALCSLAEICAQQGNAVEALTLVMYIIQHPASKQDSRDQAEKLRGKLSADWKAGEWDAAQNAAQSADFDTFLKERYGLRELVSH